MSTEQIRNILDTLQQLDEAEVEPIYYRADLGYDSVFVKYVPPGKFLISGYDIEGAYIDRDGGEAEGWFDFTYNPETKNYKIDNLTDDGSNAFFDDRLADETVDSMVKDFFKKFGTDWPTIYKNLKTKREPFEVIATITEPYKKEIQRATRIRLRRDGVDDEILEKTDIIDKLGDNWITLIKKAVRAAGQEKKWENIPPNKISRDDIQEAINLIVDWCVSIFKNPKMTYWNIIQ